jgi:hypothetical protein
MIAFIYFSCQLVELHLLEIKIHQTEYCTYGNSKRSARQHAKQKLGSSVQKRDFSQTNKSPRLLMHIVDYPMETFAFRHQCCLFTKQNALQILFLNGKCWRIAMKVFHGLGIRPKLPLKRQNPRGPDAAIYFCQSEWVTKIVDHAPNQLNVLR